MLAAAQPPARRGHAPGVTVARSVKAVRPVPATPRSYALVGAVLGLGAPVGLLLLRRLLRPRHARRRGWLLAELASQQQTYAYTALSTPLVFAALGRALARREAARERARAELDRLREEFAAVVAHDLRNPLHTILLQVDLLLREADPAARTALRRIERGARQLVQQVNDLLDASRIEAARLALHPERVSPADAVTALVEQIRPTLGQHPVTVAVEGTPPPVCADPTRLAQILTNLLENAAKYSPPEAPIAVTVRPSAAGTTIAVEDHGVGIAPAELTRLFDRFYQTRRARALKTGLGLGLYITKGLVRAHGGRLEVASTPGSGSVFSVWLPAAR